MRLLTVPNWSFGRNRFLLERFAEVLRQGGLEVHYLQGDADHNRTVSAFSGEPAQVREALLELAEAAFESIDLNRHVGVHPRVGALDVCPFVLPPEASAADLERANGVVEEVAAALAARHHVPVYLYERSERGRHEADLPSLRRGGFGALAGRELRPDFGPSAAHPRLGLTVMGVRDPLIAMNVNLRTTDVAFAKVLAKEIRNLRAEGDERFLGVRALGFPLTTQGLAQLSMNLTLPDLTPVDPIVEWAMRRASDEAVPFAGTELIGVIRKRDLPTATRLNVAPEQVVW
jgi:glutamate formiminotransferase